MGHSSTKAIFYLALTFAAGSAVGVFGHKLYTAREVGAVGRGTSRSDEYRRAYLSEMEARLKLQPDQKARVEQILEQTQSLFRQLNEKHRPEYDAIHAAQVDQMNSVLSAEQQTEYAKLRKERAERRRQRAPMAPPVGAHPAPATAPAPAR